MAYLALGQGENALEPFRQAIRLKPDSAEGHYGVGLALAQGGSWERAIEAYHRAIKIKPDLAETHLDLGAAYFKLGRLDEWSEAVAEAFRLKPELAKPLAANFHATDGLDDPNQAVALYSQRRQAAKELGDGEAEAAATLSLAEAHDSLGELADAQRYFTETIRLCRAASDTKGEARALVEIGRIDEDMGQYDNALASYHRAAIRYRDASDRSGLARALIRLGHVYESVGDVYSAIQWYQLALEISKAAGETEEEVQALVGLIESGVIAGDQQLVARCRPDFDRAFPAFMAANSQTKTGTILSAYEVQRSVARGMARWGPPDSAIPTLKFYVALYKAAAPRGRRFEREIAVDLYSLGIAYEHKQQHENALAALHEAADIAQRWSSPERYWILNEMARVREKQGKLDDALSLYKQSVELFEGTTLSQHVVELRFSLRQIGSSLYDDVARVLLKMQPNDPHYVAQSLVYHERGRARTILEVLGPERTGGKAKPGNEGRELSAAIERIQRVVHREKASGEWDARLQAALVDQTTALQAQRAGQEVSPNSKPEQLPSAVYDIAEVQASLEPDTALLEYSLADHSVLWVVTRDTVRAYDLAPEEQVTAEVEKYLKTLRTPLLGKDEIDEHIKHGYELYQLLLAPAANQLQTLKGLVIAPSASLSYLPFEALIASGPETSAARGPDGLAALTYVGKSYDVSYVPSGSVLVTLGTMGRHQATLDHQSPLLAFGDPVYERSAEPGSMTASLRSSYERGGGEFARLSHSADEVESVAAVLGLPPTSEAIKLRERATERQVRESDLTQYRVLHFAVHARAGDAGGWMNQPTLALSLAGTDKNYDGFLQMSEILTLRLNADLVVLSACETAKGKMFRGDGVVGLTSAFLYAGSRSVVASLWAVNDQSTSLFMESFYRNLGGGLSKAEALRRARVQLMHAKGEVGGVKVDYAAPYYWAPFILVGSTN